MNPITSPIARATVMFGIIEEIVSVGFRRYSLKDIGLHGPDRNRNRFALPN